MEKNQEIVGVKLHDVVVFSKHQKTGDNGEKLGYSFYEKDQMGVVTQYGEKKIVAKAADGSDIVYCVDEVEKEYYTTIGIGSEFEYEKEIKKEIAKKIKSRDGINEEIKDITDWLYDFKHSISLIGRIAKFIKNEQK